jgi:hypothetical protein
MEKVKGAGGEGFWKNAKSAPVLEVAAEAKIADMAKVMGVSPEELADKMNDQVADWQKGFDQLLMLQGMQAKTLRVTLAIARTLLRHRSSSPSLPRSTCL